MMPTTQLVSLLWLTTFGMQTADADPAPVVAAAAPTDQKPPVEVAGYLQVFYKTRVEEDGDGQTEPGVFRVLRARFELKGYITPHISYKLQVDPRSPLITGVMRDAYISLEFIPHHKLRLGQQKTQFGYENSESSTRLFVVNRASVSDNLARGITLRDLGIGLIGRLPLGHGFRIEDAITVVNGSGMNVQLDDTKRKNVWGRLGGRYQNKTASLRVRLGFSGAIGNQLEPAGRGNPPTPPDVFDFKRAGGDLEVDHRWAFMAAEYVVGTNRSAAVPEANSHSSGYYAMLVAKLPWNVGPVARFDVFDDFRRWTAGAFYGLPGDRVRVLFNYEFWRDRAGRHDDKVYLWTQVVF
jgi:hypothetical protein